MQFFCTRATAASGAQAECISPLTCSGQRIHSRWLVALSFTILAAHVCILSIGGASASTSLLSNLTQVILGVLAALAMLEAGRRSGRFARRTWFLAAMGVGIYTVGQTVFTYTYTAGQPFSRQFYSLIYDPIFFFWIVPLVAAAVADPVEVAEGFDRGSILDFSLLVLLALALHFSVFADTTRWQGRPEEMFFWRLKARLFRDLVVLGCLWGRVFFSDSGQIRSLFRRLGIFYAAHAITNASFLYVIQATHSERPVVWIDLIWSVPRVLGVLLAVSWNWREEIAPPHAAAKWPRYLLDRAPIVAPLLVLVVSSHMFSSTPLLAAGLMLAAFAIVSLRLRVAQSRQARALAGLNTSNNLLQSVIEGTSEAVYLKDANGYYLLMNAAGARLLGRTPEEIVGKTDRELFSPEEAESVLKEDQEVMRSGHALTSETVLTSIGVTRTYLSNKNPYRDSQGRVIGVLGISLDVTERRNIEQQLEKSQRMESIGTFSGGIAHDFNNLLTIIKGYSYLAHADAATHPSIRDSVEQINKAAGRASSLIDQLLAFSRQQILQPRVISLNDIVTNLRKMLDRLIGEDVRIETLLAEDLGSVKADPCQVEQVLMNLAANARDAMPSGGLLRLETANVNLNRSNTGPDFNVPPGSYVRLTVSDTGIGMDLQTQSRIFEPFFTTKAPGKGTGLGLATVYGIVKQSGGYLGVESKSGVGATFRIYLPRVCEPVEEISPLNEIPATEGGNQTILLVDDDPQLRQLAKKVLTNSGFKVLDAESGEHAGRIAGLHKGSIHLLLTDVVMPGTSGREIARRICGDGSETRVLYMSGYPGDIIAHHGVLDAGISFLQKPFSPDGLVEKVKEVLQAPMAKVAVKVGDESGLALRN